MEETPQIELIGRMIAAEHLALTALNIFVHFRASGMGGDAMDEARTVADGLLATFADMACPDAYRAVARRALKADGAALIDAARRFQDILDADRRRTEG